MMSCPQKNHKCSSVNRNGVESSQASRESSNSFLSTSSDGSKASFILPPDLTRTRSKRERHQKEKDEQSFVPMKYTDGSDDIDEGLESPPSWQIRNETFNLSTELLLSSPKAQVLLKTPLEETLEPSIFPSTPDKTSTDSPSCSVEQEEFRGRKIILDSGVWKSRNSSTATTVSCTPSPKDVRKRVFRTSKPSQDVVRRRLDFEDLSSSNVTLYSALDEPWDKSGSTVNGAIEDQTLLQFFPGNTAQMIDGAGDSEKSEKEFYSIDALVKRPDSGSITSLHQRTGSFIVRSPDNIETKLLSSAESVKRSKSPEYEVPDSQPHHLPATPLMSAPLTTLGRSRPVRLNIKRDKRNAPATPSPEFQHQMEVFELVDKVPVSPFKPTWEGASRKKRRVANMTDDLTQQATPTRPSPSVSLSPIANARTKDDLDDAISEVKRDIGTTDEEQINMQTTGTEKDLGASEVPIKASLKLNPSWQSSFVCMRKNDDDTAKSGPNIKTVEVLQRMCEHYERTKDSWRAIAYRKAIGALKKQTEHISTRAQAVKIPGIGTRLADKIEEIARTNRLRRLEYAEADPDDAILKVFTQIYGAGIAQARLWMSQGFKTLDDLRSRAELTPNQKVGLEHYDDFLQRIPCDEVKAHGSLVDDVLLEVSSKLRLTIGGSFRRGAASSGDVDFLITSIDEAMPDHVLQTMVFSQLIPRLFNIGYLKVELAGPSAVASPSANSDRGSKWHGAAVLPDASGRAWRRVDFLVVPPREWGAALIYFTGNDVFNRSMRLLARKKGMKLNQHGLYTNVMKNLSARRFTKGTLVEGRDEERIFELLGVPYRPPEERIC